MKINPAADGGVSSRGVMGTGRTESHEHYQAIQPGVYVTKGEVTQCALESNQMSLSFYYFYLFSKRADLSLKHCLAIGRDTMTLGGRSHQFQDHLSVQQRGEGSGGGGGGLDK